MLEEMNWQIANFQDLRNLAFTVVSTFGVFFLYWRTKLAQKQVEVLQANQLADTYTRALEQLGAQSSEEEVALEVRIGAIYALEKLGQNNPGYARPVLEVLASYVRVHSPAIKNEDIPNKTIFEEHFLPRQDIQTIITVIGRFVIDVRDLTKLERWLYETHVIRSFNKLGIQGINLTNCDLRGINFSSGVYDRINFNGSLLDHANFSRSYLWMADMSGCSMVAADFTFAVISGLDIDKANLYLTRLSSEQRRRCSNSRTGLYKYESDLSV